MRHGFLDRDAYRDSPIHRLDARGKILAFVAGIFICVSTPPTAYAAFAIYALALLAVLALTRLPVWSLVRRVAIVLPFAGMVALFAPFLKTDQVAGGYSLGLGATAITPALVVWNVLAKSLLSTGMIVLLTSTTPFPSLLEALRRLRVPDILVMLLSFTYRYLFVFVDEFERLQRARAARGFHGRWLWQASSLGHLIASMFVRTYERAERVYVAMVSRGFEGRFPQVRTLPFRLRDGLFLTAFLACFLTARLMIR